MSKILKTAIGFLLGPIVSSVIGFIISVGTTWILVPDEVGKASVITIFFSITSLFIYFGLDQSFIREYNDIKNKKHLFWNSVLIPVILVLITLIVCFFYHHKVSLILFQEYNFSAIFMVVMCLPFILIDRYSMIILRMLEKPYLYSLIQIINKLVNLISLIFYVVFIDKNYNAIIFSFFTSYIITASIGLFLTRQYWIYKFTIDIPLQKKLLRYGLPLVPTMIITSLFASMDKIALMKWSTYNELGIYSTGFKIASVIAIFQTAFATFWVPVSQRWYSQKKDKDQIVSVSYILTAIVSLMYALLILFKDLIVSILLPTDYQYAANIIPLISLVPLFGILSYATCVGITYSRKTEMNIIPSLVALLINFILNSIFVSSYGAMGAAISTAISYLFYFIIITQLSRLLWYKFNAMPIAINILFIIIITFISITIDNKIYILFIVMINFIYNIKFYIKIIGLLKNN